VLWAGGAAKAARVAKIERRQKACIDPGRNLI
jgi:hypothetical protein